MKALDAWSWSRYETWALCPLKFKLKFLDKLPEPGSPAMERGNVIHKQLAEYLEGRAEHLPKEIGHPFQQKLYAEMRAQDDKIIEQKWAFTATWQPTGYFAKAPKAAWLRTIVDYATCYEDLTVEVVDHKTGKMYGHNEEQIELFALSAMCHFRPAKQVLTRLIYVDAGSELRSEFNAKDRDALIAKWNAKVAPMFADTTHIARPNDKCRFCAYSKSNGGPCRFG